MTENAESTPEQNPPSDLGIADVWHAGSNSFYRAQLLEKLEPHHVLTLPPELQGEDESERKVEGIRSVIHEALKSAKNRSERNRMEEAAALAEQKQKLRLLIDADEDAMATLTGLLSRYRNITHLQSSDPLIARQIEELRVRQIGNKAKLRRLETVGR